MTYDEAITTHNGYTMLMRDNHELQRELAIEREGSRELCAENNRDWRSEGSEALELQARRERWAQYLARNCNEPEVAK